MRWRLGAPKTDVDRDRAYARWAPAYPPSAHNRLMEVEEAAVRELLPTVAGRRVLDAGCGTGRYLAILARARAEVLVGVDRSPVMLSRVDVPEARLLLGDVRQLPLAARSFDAVVCGLTLMDVDDLGAVMSELARVLRPRGVLVCSTLHPSGAERGWTRTFETSERREILPASWHSLDAHLHACQAASLVIDARREPRLADAPSGEAPVALVLRARRVP